MPKVKKTFSDEQANEWKRLYESGYGQYDMLAHESAKGKSTSWEVMKREILRVGGTLRTTAENYAVAAKNRRKSNYNYSRKPHGL